MYKNSDLNKKCKKTFTNASRFAKFVNFFFHGRFPIYSILVTLIICLPIAVITENSSQVNGPSNDVTNRRNRVVHSADSMQLVDTNPYNLKVGSVIQYDEPAQYGVIKWIGKPPGQAQIFAGLEMVKHENFSAYLATLYVHNYALFTSEFKKL